VRITWGDPASNGGATIAGYTIVQTEHGTGIERRTDIPGTFGVAGSRTLTIEPLTPGVTYDFRVFARTAAGDGASVTATATPYARPLPPQELRAVGGAGEVELSWQPPASDNGRAVDGYHVEQYDAALESWVRIRTTSLLTATVGGLTNGTEHRFRVLAQSTGGTSAASAEVVATPRTVPGAPGDVTAVAGDRSLTVGWAAPVDGGSPLTGYEVETRRVGESVWQSAGSSRTPGLIVDGLPEDVEHQVRVRARNEVGPGSWADVVQVTPFHVEFVVDGHSGLGPVPLRVGQEFRIVATGMPEDATVVLELHSDPVTLATSRSGRGGPFALVATIPTEASLGSHTLVLTVTVAGGVPAVTSLPVTIRAAEVATAGPTLAESGSDAGSAPFVALILIVLGVATLLRARVGRRGARVRG
jgi:hypothetical protein